MILKSHAKKKTKQKIKTTSHIEKGQDENKRNIGAAATTYTNRQLVPESRQ
jgi:hypothetical protein